MGPEEAAAGDWTSYRLREGEFVITLDDSNPEEKVEPHGK